MFGPVYRGSVSDWRKGHTPPFSVIKMGEAVQGGQRVLELALAPLRDVCSYARGLSGHLKVCFATPKILPRQFVTESRNILNEYVGWPDSSPNGC